MPLVRTLGVGSEAAASAVATYRRTLEPAGDPDEFTSSLLVYGMPQLTFWFQQTVGALGCQVQPEYAVRSVDALTPVVEWLPLDAAFIINPAPQNPTLRNYKMPARLIRVRISRPVGQVTRVQLVMAGSL